MTPRPILLPSATSVRLSEEDTARLDALCVALGSPAAPAPRAAVFRAALRVFSGAAQERPDLFTHDSDADALRAIGAELARGAR